MRFDRKTADRIVAGRKTQHRIPRRPLERRAPSEKVTIRHPDGTIEHRDVEAFAVRDPHRPYHPGESIPVTVMRSNPDIGYRHQKVASLDRTPKREGTQVCRINISDIRPAHLHELTQKDAMAEGFKTTDDFMAHWWDRYKEGPGKPDNPEYPVLIPVWVLIFTVDIEERPRYLSRASDVNRGYTESAATAIREEGVEGDAIEGVGDEWLSRFARESDQDQVARRVRQDRQVKKRSLEDRIAVVREAAAGSQVDLSRQLRRIEAAVNEAENKLARLDEAA